MIAAALAKSLGGKPRKTPTLKPIEEVIGLPWNKLIKTRSLHSFPQNVQEKIKAYRKKRIPGTHMANLGEGINKINSLLMKEGFSRTSGWEGESGFGHTYRHENGEHVRVNKYTKIMTWSKGN